MSEEERTSDSLSLENLSYIVSEIQTLHQTEENDAEFRRRVANLLELVNQKSN